MPAGIVVRTVLANDSVEHFGNLFPPGALHQPAHRIHQHGSCPDQCVARLQQVQVSLSYRTAMLNRRQQPHIVGREPRQLLRIVAIIFDSLSVIARTLRALATNTSCPIPCNNRLTHGECPHSIAIRCLSPLKCLSRTTIVVCIRPSSITSPSRFTTQYRLNRSPRSIPTVIPGFSAERLIFSCIGWSPLYLIECVRTDYLFREASRLIPSNLRSGF